jgi:hypothetical protein
MEMPRQWSQIATDIIAQKYFRKAGVLSRWKPGRESRSQVAHRGQLLEGLGDAGSIAKRRNSFMKS